MNDILWRSIKRAQIPAVKEPVSLIRQDGKRPDGVTLLPWARGKPLAWDITVPDTYAESHLQDTACRPGAAADKAAANKSSKYCDLAGTHLFFPVAIETAGTWNQMAVELIQEIGRRITLVTEDSRQYFCSSACPLPFNGEMRSPSSARSLPPINHPLKSFLA